MEVTGFNVKVVGKVVNDAYAIIGGDQVKVTISLKAKEGNVLASTLDVTGAMLQGATAAVENQTSTSVDLVYTYTVAKAKISSLSIADTINAPASSAAGTFQVSTLTAPTNTSISAAPASWTIVQKDGNDTIDTNDEMTAEYTLTPKAGYEFDTGSLSVGSAVSTANINNGNIKIKSADADSIVITLTLTVQA